MRNRLSTALRLLVCVVSLGFTPQAHAAVDPCTNGIPSQSGFICTAVGGFNGDGTAGIPAIVDPQGMVAVNRGVGLKPDLYIADSRGHRVRKIAGATGIMSTIAGTGVRGFSGDGGFATNAQLSFPIAVAVDGAGNVYVADGGGSGVNVPQPGKAPSRVRKISTDGRITTMAGTGTTTFAGDGGLAISAGLTAYGLAIDIPRNRLYIADAGNHRVRMVDLSTGVMSTAAGSGQSGFFEGPGPADQAKFGAVVDVAVDQDGNVYIVDMNVHWVSKLDVRLHQVSRFAGFIRGGGSNVGDGGPASAMGGILNGPIRAVVDDAANLFIVDRDDSRIRKISKIYDADPNQHIITTVAYLGVSGLTSNQTLAATLGESDVSSIAAGGSTVFVGTSHFSALLGFYYKPWSYNDKIWTMASNGSVALLAGLLSNGDGGLARNASVDPQSVAVRTTGNTTDLYIADAQNNQIRRMTGSTGLITTVVGTGIACRIHTSACGDGGLAMNAQLSNPMGVALDAAGNLYIADTDNRRVRRVAVDPRTGTVGPSSVITTVAGTGEAPILVGLPGFPPSPQEGVATQIRFAQLTGLAVDRTGNVFIADAASGIISKLTPSGQVTVAVGLKFGMPVGRIQDGIPAIGAQLSSPYDVTVASDGALYLVEINFRVRAVDPQGIITTIAPLTPFGSVQRIALDEAQHRLLIGVGGVMAGAPKVVAIDLTTSNPGIANVVGTGLAGLEGDGGLATQANIYMPAGLAVDGNGHLYLSQSDSYRIRAVTLGAATPPPANQPPSTPGQPTGPGSGVTGASLTFTASATDPDAGQKVQLEFDWGDNIFVPVPGFISSDTPVQQSHTWTSSGTYQVKVRAKDELGLFSPASAVLTVVISDPAPTTYSVSGQIMYVTVGIPIPSVTVEAQTPGQNPVTTTTDLNGRYTLSLNANKAWTITPKLINATLWPCRNAAGALQPCVNENDAWTALQGAVGIVPQTGDRFLAGDVNADHAFSAVDALSILAHHAGKADHFILSTLCGSDWFFHPRGAPGVSVSDPTVIAHVCTLGRISYSSLSANQTNQDFSALLIGDITGAPATP